MPGTYREVRKARHAIRPKVEPPAYSG